jgi:GxxExxY protein
MSQIYTDGFNLGGLMPELLYKELTFAVIGAAMEVHKILGPGFLEAVYQSALARELTLRDIPFEQQVRLPVTYKDTLVGDYVADFVIDGKLIVEIKASSQLDKAHQAQSMHYLAATGLRLALLINFGASSLEYKRIIK